MKIKKVEITHDDIMQLAQIAVKQMGQEYVKTSDEMIIIGSESYKMRTNSTQWNMVVLRKKGRKVEIDMVGTAGGSGIFNISWWSESGFTKGMFKHFKKHCEDKGWNLQEVT